MNVAALIIRAAAGHAAALSALARTSNMDAPIARTAALILLDPPAPPLTLAVVAGLLRRPPAHLLTPLSAVVADAVLALRSPSSSALRHELRRRGRMHAVLMALARSATNADDAVLSDLADLARTSPSAAAGCMHGLGAAGWQRLTRDQRSALLGVITPYLTAHAASLGAVWSALDDEERIAAAALLNDRSIFAVMSSMGADGWRRTPSFLRQRWLQTAPQSPDAPAILGGIWTALDEDEQIHVCETAIHTALDAVRLMECMGSEGWSHAVPEVRDHLIRATLKQKWTTVNASVIWSALEERHQEQILCAIAHDQAACQALIAQVGRDAWFRTPLHIRNLARQSVPADREAILATARLELPPWAIVRLDDDHWEMIPSHSAPPSPLWLSGGAPSRAAVAFWTALTPHDRMRIVMAAADFPGLMATLATYLGRAGWQATEEDARASIIQCVTGDADAAAITVIALGDAVSDRRDDLLPAMLGSEAKAGIELALRMRSPWRDWMRHFNVSALRVGAALHLSLR